MAERTLPVVGIDPYGMSPLDSYTYQQNVPGLYVESVAKATGTVPGIYALVRNIGARTTGELKGMSINVEPLAGYDCYGITGAEICVYATTGTTTTRFRGLFVECQGLSTAITSDWYALYVYSAPGIAPGASSGVCRLEHNSAVATDTFLAFVNSSTSPSYLFTTGPNATGTCWNYNAAAKTNAAGWLLIKVGTNARYINTYSS